MVSRRPFLTEIQPKHLSTHKTRRQATIEAVKSLTLITRKKTPWNLHMILACDVVKVIIFVQQMCEKFSPLRLTPSRLSPVTNWTGKIMNISYTFLLATSSLSKTFHKYAFWHRIPSRKKTFFLLLLRFNIKNHLLKLISVSVLLGSCKAIEPTLHFYCRAYFFSSVVILVAVRLREFLIIYRLESNRL